MTTHIPSIPWYAVVLGAGVNILLLLMVRARPPTHFVLGTISAFFVGVIIFVILALDAPLRGPEGLSSKPYQDLWQQQMIRDDPRG